jgi:hypothetical protein
VSLASREDMEFASLRLQLDELRAERDELRAEFRLILATAPWPDHDGHVECLKIARRALEPKL